MDSYMYNADPYRQSSAGYYVSRYEPSYGMERRNGLPQLDSISSYHYPGYSFQSAPRYAAPPFPPSPVFLSHPRPNPKKKPPPAQTLGPKKKPFKQSQKSNEKLDKAKNVQKNTSQTAKNVSKPNAKAEKPQDLSLAKETEELHSLFRTGVDPSTGKKFNFMKLEAAAAAKKRKAEALTQGASVSEKDSTLASKKLKGMKKMKAAKQKPQKGKKTKLSVSATIVESIPLTEEEEKEKAEAALEVQRGVFKSVDEFFGFPPAAEEAEAKEAADATESEARPEQTTETEKTKPDEPRRTPEEEKMLEDKAFEFFSKLFEDSQDVRKLYIDQCFSGTFECLVCHTVNSDELSRKFWNVVSLVMHAKMVKEKGSDHRGYGRAVAAVLGWDLHKLPKVPKGTQRRPPAVKIANQVKDDNKPEAIKSEAKVDEETMVLDTTTEEMQSKEKQREELFKDAAEE